MKKYAVFLLALTLSFFSLSAQFFSSGEEPSLVSYKQICTQNFQIIFAPEFGLKAQRLANILEYIYTYDARGLKHLPRKRISVLLHNRSVEANGYVSWAPRRMELFPTAPQQGFSTDWLELLAVHESRHVIQIDKLEQGVTRLAYFILGEQAEGAIAGLLPRWFLEGDAVYAETALTSSGRGRDASFDMEMKALVLEKPHLFSYEKMLRGSYRDYIPDQYHFGYPLVAWTRKKYGNDVFAKTLDYVGRNPYLFYPFPLGLKKTTGHLACNLYSSAFSDLKTSWGNSIPAKLSAPEYFSNPLRDIYTMYRFPHRMPDNSVLAVKTGMDCPVQIVQIFNSRKERIFHIPANSRFDNLSVSGNLIAWAEPESDIRWPNKSYQVIKIADLASGEVKKLSHRTRLFAPALSSNGTKLIAVETSLANESRLVILDTQSGNEEGRIAAPEGSAFQMPCWNADDSEIYVTEVHRNGESLISIKYPSLDRKVWFSVKGRNIYSCSDAGSYLLFSSDRNGIANIYAINKASGAMSQLTNEAFGAFDPQFDAANQRLLYTRYSSHGYHVVSLPFQPDSAIVTGSVSDSLSNGLYKVGADLEHFNFQDSVVPSYQYPEKPFRKIPNLFQIHSWAPFYYDYQNMGLDNTTASPGISILSQDKLNTTEIMAGLAYIDNETYLNTSVTYKGLFPVFTFAWLYGGYRNYK